MAVIISDVEISLDLPKAEAEGPAEQGRDLAREIALQLQLSPMDLEEILQARLERAARVYAG